GRGSACVDRAQGRNAELHLPGASGTLLRARPRHSDVLARPVRSRRYPAARRAGLVRDPAAMRSPLRRARSLAGRARRRLAKRASGKAEHSVTAAHWGEEARTKVEGDEWTGLYWQSYILTQRNINKAIAGDPDENWLHF